MASSFRNLPDKLSMPAALDEFKPFKIFHIFFRQYLEKSENLISQLSIDVIVECDFRFIKDIW